MSLKVIPLSQAFSVAIFHICSALRSPSASAELLVLLVCSVMYCSLAEKAIFEPAWICHCRRSWNLISSVISSSLARYLYLTTGLYVQIHWKFCEDNMWLLGFLIAHFPTDLQFCWCGNWHVMCAVQLHHHHMNQSLDKWKLPELNLVPLWISSRSFWQYCLVPVSIETLI